MIELLNTSLLAFFAALNVFLLWAVIFLHRAERLRGGYARKAGEG